MTPSTPALEAAIRAAATPRDDGRKQLTCVQALALARQHGLPPAELRAVCDTLDVRICACQLGCFA